MMFTANEITAIMAVVKQRQPRDMFEGAHRTRTLRALATHQPHTPLHLEPHLIGYLKRVLTDTNRPYAGMGWVEETALNKLHRNITMHWTIDMQDELT